MERKKRTIAALLILALCLTVAACGGSDDPADTASGSENTGSSQPTGGSEPTGGNVLSPSDVIGLPEGEDVHYADTIEVLLETAVNVIDPYHPAAGGGGQRVTYRCVMDTLISRTQAGEYIPDLATSWNTDDAQTYTFTLRDDVYFHNGQKFTAQDVADTVLVAHRDGVGSNGYECWRSVEEVNILGDYEVEIVLSAVNVDFLYDIATPVASIVNRAAREADPVAGAWVGTGAFYMSDFVSGQEFTLTRNDDYFGEAPITRVLHFRHIPENAARSITMLNGEGDVIISPAVNDMNMFVDNPDFYIYNFMHNVSSALNLNLNNPITGDINFRLAVAHALYTPDIAAVVVGDWGAPPTDGAVWGFATEFRNTDIPIYEYNPDLAREYLAASSYNGEEIQIMAGMPTNIMVQDLIAEQLGRVGINTTLFNTDNATIISTDVNSTETQIINGVLPFSNNAASCRNIYLPNGGSNRGKYNNQEIVDLLMLATTILDAGEREAVYRRVQEIAYEDVAIIPIFYRATPIVTVSNFGGLVVSNDHNHDYRYIFKVIED